VKYVGPAGTAGYDAVGNVLAYQYIDNTGRVDQYETTYEMKDGYLESATTGTSSGVNVRPTTDESYYDDRGNRIAIAQHTQYGGGTVADTVRLFSYDGNGEILTRRDGTANGTTIDQGSNASHENQHYAYVNGQQVAHWDEGGTVDVLSEVTAFSNSQSGTSGYVVQAGDTLKSMAQAIYGDANLWYVIAAANSLSSDNDLSIGQNLTIPQVTTNSNDATTFKPYNASQISGSTTPSLPTIAPPPPPTSQHCNVIATIVVIAVELVVTYFTGSPVLGNIAGQVVGNILGTQDGFDVKQVAVAAISEGIADGVDELASASSDAGAVAVSADEGSVATSTAGTASSVSESSVFAANVARGAGLYLGNYAAEKIVGEPAHFSWAGLVASSVATGASKELGSSLKDSDVGIISNRFVGNVAAVATNDLIDKGLSEELGDNHVPTWRQIGIDVGGSTLGNAAIAGLNAAGLPRVNVNALLFNPSSPATQPANQKPKAINPYGIPYAAGNSVPDPDVAMAQAALGNQSDWTAYVDTSGMGASASEEPGGPLQVVVYGGKMPQTSPNGVYTLNQGDGPLAAPAETSGQAPYVPDPSKAIDLDPVTVTPSEDGSAGNDSSGGANMSRLNEIAAKFGAEVAKKQWQADVINYASHFKFAPPPARFTDAQFDTYYQKLRYAAQHPVNGPNDEGPTAPEQLATWASKTGFANLVSDDESWHQAQSADTLGYLGRASIPIIAAGTVVAAPAISAAGAAFGTTTGIGSFGGELLAWGAVSAGTDALNQTAEITAYGATNGLTGKSSYDVGETVISAGVGIALPYAGRVVQSSFAALTQETSGVAASVLRDVGEASGQSADLAIGGEAATVSDTGIFGARGPVSGREFDLAQAGGPIENLSTEGVQISHEGVDTVEQHLARFGQDDANDFMINRLRQIAGGSIDATQEDLNFYTHESREFQRYSNLGWPTGQPTNPVEAYELWNNAHTATLEDYGLKDGQLYHPDAPK